jgi:hypothetical protein
VAKVLRGAVVLFAFVASEGAWAADRIPVSNPAADYSPPTIYSPTRAQNWGGLSIGIVRGGGLDKSGQSFADGSFTTDDYTVKQTLQLGTLGSFTDQASRCRFI